MVPMNSRIVHWAVGRKTWTVKKQLKKSYQTEVSKGASLFYDTCRPRGSINSEDRNQGLNDQDFDVE